MDNNVVAGNDACSWVWAVSSGSDTIVLSYEPIGIVPELDSSGSVGGKEGSPNIGHTEAILGSQQWWICCIDGYVRNQYINITTDSSSIGLALHPELLELKLSFSDPTLFGKQS